MQIEGVTVYEGLQAPSYKRWEAIISKMRHGQALKLENDSEYQSIHSAARRRGIYLMRQLIGSKILVFKVTKAYFEKHKRPGGKTRGFCGGSE